MNKEELNRLAMDVAEMMVDRPSETILTRIAQNALDEGRHVEYLQMMWEQANQASREVETVLGTEMFNKVLALKESDFD